MEKITSTHLIVKIFLSSILDPKGSHRTLEEEKDDMFEDENDHF